MVLGPPGTHFVHMRVNAQNDILKKDIQNGFSSICSETLNRYAPSRKRYLHPAQSVKFPTNHPHGLQAYSQRKAYINF